MVRSANLSYAQGVSNVAANQIIVTPPPVGSAMLSSTTYQANLTAPVVTNSAMNTSIMRNSIVQAPVPVPVVVPEQSLYDVTVGPIVNAVTDIFAPVLI